MFEDCHKKHRDEKGVHKNNGKRGGVKFALQIGHIEIPYNQPHHCNQKPYNGGVVRRVGGVAHLAKHSVFGGHIFLRQQVHTTSVGHHNAVGTAQTGDDDKNKKKCATHFAKNFGKRLLDNFSVVATQKIVGVHCARESHKVDEVDANNNHRANDECKGQIAFCVFDFWDNAGYHNPPIIGKQCTQECRKKIGLSQKGDAGRAKVGHRGAVCKPHNRAYDGHQHEGY